MANYCLESNTKVYIKIFAIIITGKVLSVSELLGRSEIDLLLLLNYLFNNIYKVIPYKGNVQLQKNFENL